jgi:hypothetical protein
MSVTTPVSVGVQAEVLNGRTIILWRLWASVTWRGPPGHNGHPYTCTTGASKWIRDTLGRNMAHSLPQWSSVRHSAISVTETCNRNYSVISVGDASEQSEVLGYFRQQFFGDSDRRRWPSGAPIGFSGTELCSDCEIVYTETAEPAIMV